MNFEKLNNIYLFAVLSKFVTKICADRDESHGLLHMVTVMMRAIGLLPNDADNKTFVYVPIVAMLHDVADHKYDTTGTLKT